MACLSIALLRTLDVSRDGQPVTGFVTDKVRALLVYLVMEADRPHRRGQLAELLWPEHPVQVARNSLRQALATLRQAIGDHTATPPFLHISAETIQFNAASDYWLDVAVFTDLLEACRRHRHACPEQCTPCAHRLQEAVALYRGSFLDQFFVSDSVAFEEWTLLHRERLRRLAYAATAWLTTYFERRGAYDLAESSAWQQVELDPWREEAHRQLMRVLALSGQRSAALRQYETCRRVLQDELGVPPAPKTTALREQIRAGTVEDSPAHRRASPQLPAFPTVFIGRQHERAELAELLTDRSMRLVTLVGAPGIGKTRLALAVAADIEGDFEGGAAFVALAPVKDWELVVPTIAQALGVRATSDRPVLDTLIGVLRAKAVLLLLDNFEHVLPAATHITTLLAACPLLKVLVTSRAPLHLSAEHTVAVPPLTLPDTAASLAAVTTSDAGALFIARATALQRDFAITEGTAPAIAAICTQLDGLPLAIELAAARSPLLTPDTLLARLEHRLDLLTGGPRDAPARQQTLRATIDWSYQLLPAADQRLFAWLAVFVGGWTLDAAEAICAGQCDGGMAVLNGLQSLVDQHLVQPASGSSGPARFTMLETIREYALGCLEASGDGATLRQRHARYFLTLAETAEPALRGPTQATWLRQLQVEDHNLRAVLRWSCASNNAELALRMVGALWQFWLLHGRFQEWDHWLTAALTLDRGQQPGNTEPGAARSRYGAKALAGRSVLAAMEDDTAWLATFGPQSLALCRAAKDMRGTALVLSVATPAAAGRDDERGAVGMMRAEGLRLARELGDSWLLAWTLARQAHSQGSLWQHLDLLEEGLTHARSAGDPWLVAWLLHWLGMGVHDAGDHGRARMLLEESLAIRRTMGDRLGIAHSLMWLASQAISDSAIARARAYTDERLQLEQALGNRLGMADADIQLGRLALMADHYGEARTHFEAALAVFRERGHSERTQSAMLYLGLVAHAEGKLTEAMVRFEAMLPLHDAQEHTALGGQVWIYLGQTALAAGDISRATSAFDKGLGIWQALGSKWGMEWALNNLAKAAQRAGDDEAAAAHWTRCIALVRETGGRGRLVECLTGLASLAARRGRWERAACLFGAAEALDEPIDEPIDADAVGVDNERTLAALRVELDASVFAAAWAAGRAMTLEQAIAYALEETA